MNPQEAKTKIEALLNLGTLKGVKVGYEDGEEIHFIKSPEGKILRGLFKYPSDSYQEAEYDEGHYVEIKSIHPIPLEPKLLEVGTNVEIIGGVADGGYGAIESWNGETYTVLFSETGCRANVAPWHVVPESLLVEEDENKEAKAILGEFQYNALIKAGYKLTKQP